MNEVFGFVAGNYNTTDWKMFIRNLPGKIFVVRGLRITLVAVQFLLLWKIDFMLKYIHDANEILLELKFVLSLLSIVELLHELLES